MPPTRNATGYQHRTGQGGPHYLYTKTSSKCCNVRRNSESAAGPPHPSMHIPILQARRTPTIPVQYKVPSDQHHQLCNHKGNYADVKVGHRDSPAHARFWGGKRCTVNHHVVRCNVNQYGCIIQRFHIV